MNDLRLAVRALRATPIASLVAALSLALGIGANTAIFSLLNSLLLRTLPAQEPERLVTISSDAAVRMGFKAGLGWNYAMWDRFRQRADAFDGAIAWTPQRIDLGRVGKVTRIDADLLRDFCEAGIIPLIPSVALDEQGGWLNVNADTAAAALAAAVGAAKLLVLTDVEGLYADWPASDEVLSGLTADELEQLLPGLAAGMIPKMEACLRAVRGGVPKAHVLDGRLPHALLLELFTAEGVGTQVVP
jgi:ABC-type amino acid transport substrate-binding protein